MRDAEVVAETLGRGLEFCYVSSALQPFY